MASTDWNLDGVKGNLVYEKNEENYKLLGKGVSGM